MGELTNYALNDGVATITLDDGKANVLSIAMLASINASLDRAEADKTPVVIAGPRGAFPAASICRCFKAATRLKV